MALLFQGYRARQKNIGLCVLGHLWIDHRRSVQCAACTNFDHFSRLFLFGLCAHLAIEFLRDVAALAWGKIASLPKALPQAGLPLPLVVKALARKADFVTAWPQSSPLSRLKWPLPGLKR